MKTPLLIFGAKIKGRIALEILQSNNFIIYGILDDDETLQKDKPRWNNVPLLSTTQDEAYLKLLGKKCHPFIAIEDLKKCEAMVDQLSKSNNLSPINAIHPATTLSEEARLGRGNIIHVGTSIGSHTTIHDHCTLSGHNMIGHDSILHDFVYLEAGVIVNPGVTIHKKAYIGSGAILSPGITIGAYAHVAPGSVVLKDVPEKGLVGGNPAIQLDNKTL